MDAIIYWFQVKTVHGLEQKQSDSIKSKVQNLYKPDYNTPVRGVEIVKFSICPGTSKWP